MAKHAFRITVEHLSDPRGNPGDEPPLVFSAENHDNILELASRHGMRSDKDLAFLLGLKLFGEALLDDRDNPLLQELKPHFGTFMKKFKAARRGSPGAGA